MQEKIINTIVLVFEQYIHATRCFKKKPNFIEALSRVVSHRNMVNILRHVAIDSNGRCLKWLMAFSD